MLRTLKQAAQYKNGVDISRQKHLSESRYSVIQSSPLASLLGPHNVNSKMIFEHTDVI
jgi:hypothetical protein